MTSCKRRLLVDIETYSSVDITKAGAFKYIESDDFEILLIAYVWNDEPVRVLDLTSTDHENDEYQDIVAGLLDQDTIKIAHNSAFERAALGKHLGRYLPPEEWEDTMILAAYNGLPLSLDAVGAALRLHDQKIKEGTSLISYFCKPCKPTISNGGRTRNMPHHAPDKWARFREYCRRDVEVAQAIYNRLSSYPVTDFERQVWATDARINERGVQIDRELVESAIAVDNAFREEHLEEMRRLTGLDNPNSVQQLKAWLSAAGIECDSLSKATIADIKCSATDNTTKRVLELRQMLSKTSTKKYEAMTAAACKDDRVCGLTQYYGAARTGRWAGRLIQLQNLPQNHLDNIGTVREIVRARDLESLEMIFDSVPDTLSQLIRTALVAKPGCTFLVSDYSAIEARVIAYLAGETWRMEVFKNGGDIYCASASQMFHVPVEKHGVNGHLRQKGKIAELALGYGGGIGAMKNFGADKMGMTDEEMLEIVNQWRVASPTIPKLWRDVEKAARSAIENPGRSYRINCGVVYRRDTDALRCKLPSGRWLTYWEPRIEDEKIYFMGQNQTTRKWEKTDTWGGKLTENIVQAFARDCLAVAMVRLEEAGYHIVFTVHDEVIVEAPEGSRWQDVAEIMGQPIDWAPGLILHGDGYETKFYMKD